MTKTKTKAVTVMAALLLPAASAHAQTVTFTDINDAVPGKFFDAASSVPDASDPNTLVIGLNTGLDGTIWKHRDFKASLLPFSYPSATDTISFVIHAPDGYYVATVTYQENLVLGNSRFGRAFAATQLVVNGVATEEHFADLSDLGATRVPMSITTSLVAANADAKVVDGRVVVQVLPLPEPPPVLDVPPVPAVPEVPAVPAVLEVPAVPAVLKVPTVPVPLAR